MGRRTPSPFTHAFAPVEYPPHRIRLLDNGLLDVNNIPDHLVEVVRHNAACPLLHLPGELRNRIWYFVSDPQIKDGFLEVYDRLNIIRPALHIFALPRVCGQFHLELSQLLYKRTVFEFPLYDNSVRPPFFRMAEDWVEGLIQAQREAVETISYSSGRYQHRDNFKPVLPLSTVFPNLKCIMMHQRHDFANDESIDDFIEDFMGVMRELESAEVVFGCRAYDRYVRLEKRVRRGRSSTS